MSSISAAAAYHAIKSNPSPTGANNQKNGHNTSIGGTSFNNLANSTAKYDTIITNTKPLVRPTSKTAQLVRERRARLEVLEQLKCFLCKGYLIDATTIGECMDSFCRSCIVGHLANNMHCPKCSILIHKTKPLSMLRSDRVLQDIVYKLVPGLYDSEMERRRKFYSLSTGASSSNDSARDDGVDIDNDPDCDEYDDDGNESYATIPSGTNNSGNKFHNIDYGERLGRVPNPKPFYSPTDHIDISIESTSTDDSISSIHESSSNLLKIYLRCPAIFKISHLKKFISIKFGITSGNHLIKVFHSQDLLQDDYTLIDIAYMYDWRGKDPIRLHYTLLLVDKMDAARTTPSYQIVSHEGEACDSAISNKKVKMDGPPLAGYSHGRVIMQVTKSSSFYTTPRAIQTPSPSRQNSTQSPTRYMLPSFVNVDAGIINRPTTSLSYSISGHNPSVRPQVYTTTGSVCSMASISPGNDSNMVPVVSKCAIQSSTSIPAENKRIGPSPIYQQSSVESLNHHTYSRMQNGSRPGDQHSSVNKFEPNQQQGNSSTRTATASTNQPGSKIVQGTITNNRSVVRNTDASVAFSFVTERGITIVRGVNRSGGQTTQTTEIRPTTSTSITGTPPSKSPFKNSGTIAIT